MATRGSRRVLRPLTELSSVAIKRQSPSRPIQTGALCGEPSESSVARWAKLRPSIRRMTSAESLAGIKFSSGTLLCLRRKAQQHPESELFLAGRIAEVRTYCSRKIWVDKREGIFRQSTQAAQMLPGLKSFLISWYETDETQTH